MLSVEPDGLGMPRGLYLGDLSASAQSALEASVPSGSRYDLVKVAHHGSADQLPALYAHVRPRVALIGVGADNDYGHPRAETLAFLEAGGVEIIRSDVDGLALTRLVTRDGATQLELWREHARAVVPAG